MQSHSNLKMNPAVRNILRLDQCSHSTHTHAYVKMQRETITRPAQLIMVLIKKKKRF